MFDEFVVLGSDWPENKLILHLDIFGPHLRCGFQYCQYFDTTFHNTKHKTAH